MVERGVPAPHLMISDRAQVVMPYHILQDTYEEARLAGKSYGSTKSGIAPFYSDKFAKIGFQVSELFDDEVLEEKLQKVCTLKNVLFVNLYHQEPLDPKELLNTLHGIPRHGSSLCGQRVRVLISGGQRRQKHPAGRSAGYDERP